MCPVSYTHLDVYKRQVSKLPAEGDVRTVSVMAHGYDPYLGKRNPYLSGVYATVSCLSKMV